MTILTEEEHDALKIISELDRGKGKIPALRLSRKDGRNRIAFFLSDLPDDNNEEKKIKDETPKIRTKR
tara:strand:- start:225 stop:428 length:204 start_codon:yes stop_codon:yes gene_type:complete